MNIHQQSFITEYLRTGDKIQSYKNAYNCESTNYNSLESAANRLMRMPEIVNTIQAIQSSIRAEVETELKAQLKQELLTIQQKRELLAQIATGQMIAEQHYKGKNCSQCTQYIKPTINQMLKAIDLDNKMAGHYAHQKKQEPVHSVKHSSLSHAGGGGMHNMSKAAECDCQPLYSYRDGEVESQNAETTTNYNMPPAGGGDFLEVGVGTHNMSKNAKGTTNQNNLPTREETTLRLSASAVKNEKQRISQQNRTTEPESYPKQHFHIVT